VQIPAPVGLRSRFADPPARLKVRGQLSCHQPFLIQVAGERFWVPERAQFSVEHEGGEDEKEVEFLLKWSIGSEPEDYSDDDSTICWRRTSSRDQGASAYQTSRTVRRRMTA
jgi:hypothetical protein